MNNDFWEQQKNLAIKRLESLKEDDAQTKEKVSIVSEYLSSLLHPESYPDTQKEDLRKLALELGYKEETDFATWEKSVSTLGAELP